MAESRSCLLVASSEVLTELHANCMLPELSLHLLPARLEDTATEAFVESLRKYGVVAIPSGLLTGDLDEEPLSEEARRDYLSNLQQRLRRSCSVHLHVVRRDTPDDWAKRARQELEQAASTASSDRITPPTILVVVMLCRLDSRRHAQLQEFDELAERLARRFLMTEKLMEREDQLVQAEWVWPVAVGRLLMCLRMRDLKRAANEQSDAWFAWKTVDIGPRPSDESVEALRRAWTTRLLLPTPEREHVVEHPAIAAPTPAAQLDNDPEVQETRRRVSIDLDHGSTALSAAARALRTTPGDADTDSGEGSSTPTAFVGWSAIGERFGSAVAKSRARSTVVADRAQSDAAPDLAAFSHYVRRIHAFLGNILAIPERVPSDAVAPAPTASQQSRKILADMADRRVQRRADAHGVLMSAQERDLADQRFMPLSRRLGWGLVGLACTMATWLALSRFLLESWPGVSGWIVHGCIASGATFGFLGGALIPWWAERTCMERADQLLDRNIRDRRHERVRDIEAIRTAIIEPADLGRRDRVLRVAWEQACAHCTRLRWIIEKVIADARLPSLAARESQDARVPDEFRNLWHEDTSEYRQGSVEATGIDAVKSEEIAVAKLMEDLSPELLSRAHTSAARQLANPWSPAAGAASDHAESPNANGESLADVSEIATRWTATAARLDPHWHAHLPTGPLQSALADTAADVRVRAMDHLRRRLLAKLGGSGQLISDKLPKLDDLKKSDFLSCRLAGQHELPGEGLVFTRNDLGADLLKSVKEWVDTMPEGISHEDKWVTSLALYFHEEQVEIHPTSRNTDAEPRPDPDAFEVRLRPKTVPAMPLVQERASDGERSES